MNLSPAQQRALRLVRDGGYFYHPDSGAARYRNHRPGKTPIIARRTLAALLDAGLLRYSVSYHGLVELTEIGHAHLPSAAVR